MNISKLKILYVVLFMTGVLIPFSFSSAVSEIGVYAEDINVTLSPENPEPYQDVTIKLSSYSTDLNKAMVEWKNGSKILLSGYGKLSYSFKTLGPDVPVSFQITITPEGGLLSSKIIKGVTIRPSDIELLWEAEDGYTPPFYKGKAFVSTEGGIKVVAIPNTKTIQSGKGKIAYSWKNNDDAVLSASGYGKDYYSFKNSELNSNENVTVIASSVDGQYNATKTIDIPIVSPKILFYKRSPTEGVLYNKALENNTFLNNNEMTVVAEPYFLALKGNETKFTYQWKINGNPIATPSKKTEVTIAPTSRGGYATIAVTLENFSTFFQKVTGQLKLTL